MQMISLPSRGIDYGGAEKRSKRSTILENLLLYSSLDDLFVGISILKTYHDFDSILLLFPNIIDEKDRRNRMTWKRETGKTQT